MLICGIQYAEGTSKKTGKPYQAYVLHGLSRRSDDSIQSNSFWISPTEYESQKPRVGDHVRQFSDGGILIQEHSDITEFLSLV